MSEARTMAGSLNQSTLSSTEQNPPKKRLTFLESHNESQEQPNQELKEENLQTTCGKIEKRFSRFSVYNQGLQLEKFNQKNPVIKRNNTEIKEEDESCLSDTYERSNSNFFDHDESKFQFQNHSLYRQQVEDKFDQSKLSSQTPQADKDTLITIKRATASRVSGISNLQNEEPKPKKDVIDLSLSNSNTHSHLSEQDIVLFSRSNLDSSTTDTASNNRKSILSGGFRLSIMKEDLIQSKFQEELLNQALQSMSKSSLETSLLKSGLYRNEFGKSLIKMDSDIDFKRGNTMTHEPRKSLQHPNCKSRLSALNINTDALRQLEISNSPKNRQRSPKNISPQQLSTIKEKKAELNPSIITPPSSTKSIESTTSNPKTPTAQPVMSEADRYMMNNTPSQNLFLKKSKQRIEEIGYRDSTDINNTDQKSIIKFYNHWKLQEEADTHQQLSGKIEEKDKRFQDFDNNSAKVGEKRLTSEDGNDEMKNKLTSLISNPPSRDSGDFNIFNAEFDSSMVDSINKSKESRKTIKSLESASLKSNSVNHKANLGFMNLLSETQKSQSDGRNSLKSWGAQTQMSDRDSLFGGKMSLLSKNSVRTGSLIQQNSLISHASNENERISVIADKVLNQQNRNSLDYQRNFKKKLSIQTSGTRNRSISRSSTIKNSRIPKLKSQFSDNLSGLKNSEHKENNSFTDFINEKAQDAENSKKRENNMFLYGYADDFSPVEKSEPIKNRGRESIKEIIKTYDKENFRGSLLIMNNSESKSYFENEEDSLAKGSQLLIVKKKGGGFARLKSDQEVAENKKSTEKVNANKNFQNINKLLGGKKSDPQDPKFQDNQKSIFEVQKDFPDSSENYLSNFFFIRKYFSLQTENLRNGF